jgi:Tol biopolymer transport system component/dienelactone hydrolase
MTNHKFTMVSVLFAVATLTSIYSSAAPVLKGPPLREITDPRSLVSPELATAKPISIADLFAVRTGSSGVWSADGKDVIVSIDLTGRRNLWKVPARGGFPLELTRSDDRQFGQVATPDGRWIIFQSDLAGGEMYDLYAVPAAGGAARNLTNTADASETNPVISPNGLSVAFAIRRDIAASANVAILDLATMTVRQLTDEPMAGMSEIPVVFSRDGQRLFVNRVNLERTESSVWSIDVATGKSTLFSGTSRFNLATDLSPDGRWIGITTETAAGNRQAALLDVTNKQMTMLAPSPWEQCSGRFSPDGRTLIAISNVDGRDVVLSYDLTSRAAKTLVIPEGVNNDWDGYSLAGYSLPLPAFSPDGTRLLYSHESGSESFDYWIMDVLTGKSDPITNLGLASISAAQLPKTHLVHYRSADGTVISAFVWIPFNLSRDTHAPAVVLPHGGPTSQTHDEFSRTAIALASRGYLVIAPNPRGSTGYGRAFEEGNRHDLGGGDLQDEVAGAQFLVDTGYVDKKKIGIAGGSYGGYMTLMALGKTPAVWAAGVEEYGIVDWRSLHDRTSPWLRKYVEVLLGDPEKEPASYAAASPLTYLSQVRAPLLVLQGENDIRVPKEEAEQVADRLNRAGQIVEAHYYAEEGHVFAKRENQIDALQRLVDWFDKYIKGTGGN